VLGAPGSVFAANYANSILNGGGIGNTLLNFRTATNSIAWQFTGCYPTTPGGSSTAPVSRSCTFNMPPV
jgi:hypothetical protein